MTSNHRYSKSLDKKHLKFLISEQKLRMQLLILKSYLFGSKIVDDNVKNFAVFFLIKKLIGEHVRRAQNTEFSTRLSFVEGTNRPVYREGG